MNSLIFSAFVVVVAIFHLMMKGYMKQGSMKTERLKTIFCAGWCMDSVFAICGTVLSFVLYRYVFYPYLTVRNVMLVLVYLLITLLLVWAAPSGILLLGKKKSGEEEVLEAEYRLNETLELVRNCFMLLLFLLPVLFAVAQNVAWFKLPVSWKEAEICGGFCFVAFLILLPVSLRQTIFWLRNLTDGKEEAEEKLLKQYQMRLRYKHRNYWLR